MRSPPGTQTLSRRSRCFRITMVPTSHTMTPTSVPPGRFCPPCSKVRLLTLVLCTMSRHWQSAAVSPISISHGLGAKAARVSPLAKRAGVFRQRCTSLQICFERTVTGGKRGEAYLHSRAFRRTTGAPGNPFRSVLGRLECVSFVLSSKPTSKSGLLVVPPPKPGALERRPRRRRCPAVA